MLEGPANREILDKNLDFADAVERLGVRRETKDARIHRHLVQGCLGVDGKLLFALLARGPVSGIGRLVLDGQSRRGPAEPGIA